MKIFTSPLPAIIMWYRNKLRLIPVYLFLLLLGQEGFGQDTNILFQVNYAGFQMKDLKEMQQDLLSDLETTIDGKVVSSFPSFTGYELNFNSGIAEDHQIGAYMGYYSTGGRIHYRDYSGEVKIDQLVNNLSLGLYNEFIFHHLRKSELFLSTRAGISISSYQIDVFFRNGEETDSEILLFNSNNFHFSPGLGYHQPLGKHLFLRAEARYEHHLTGPLRLNTNTDAKLADDNGNFIKADWSGFRFGVSAGVRF